MIARKKQGVGGILREAPPCGWCTYMIDGQPKIISRSFWSVYKNAKAKSVENKSGCLCVCMSALVVRVHCL